MASSVVECSICVSAYDATEHRPQILSDCGHTFCAACVTTLNKQSDHSIISVECPVCRRVSTAFAGKGFATNFSILDVVGITLPTPPPQHVIAIPPPLQSAVEEEVVTVSAPIRNSGFFDLIAMVKDRLSMMPGVRTCEIRASISNSGTMTVPLFFSPGDKLPADAIVVHFYDTVRNSGTMCTETHRGVVGVLHRSMSNSGMITGQSTSGLKKISASKSLVTKSKGGRRIVFHGDVAHTLGSFCSTDGVQTIVMGTSGQPTEIYCEDGVVAFQSGKNIVNRFY